MIVGEALIVACALWCALSCLLMWWITERERRFLSASIRELQRLNDEWHAEVAASLAVQWED